MVCPPTDPSAGGNINKLLSLVVMVSFIVLCYTGTLFESKAMKQWGLSVPATEKAPSVLPQLNIQLFGSAASSVVARTSACTVKWKPVLDQPVHTTFFLLWLNSFDQSQNHPINFLCEDQVNKATSFLVLCGWSVTWLKKRNAETRKTHWEESNENDVSCLLVCLSCASMVFMYHVTNQLKEPITASFSWTLSGLICEVSQYFSRKRWVDERSFSLYVKRHFFGVKPQTVFHIIIIYISNRKNPTGYSSYVVSLQNVHVINRLQSWVPITK